MQDLRSRLAGRQVEARGEPWIVLRAEPYDSCTIVTLRGTGDGNLGRTTDLIAPFDRLQIATSAARARRASRRRVLRTAAAAIARAHTWREPWIAATAHIDLHSWQLEPAMAAVGGSMRLLLADAVGLGKTIQAGLILAELRARALIRRTLILTPASLREQWAAELRDRFALDPLVLDHATLTRLTAELPPDVNPWSIAEIGISSIDLVKRGEIRRALDAIPLDLLIVDEAHHLRPGTDRGALVEDLAARVPWVVLATATPHSGDEPAYTFLQRLGAHSANETVATFRRSAAIAGRRHSRRVTFHQVRATGAERCLLDETLAYARAIWTEHRALVAAVICRRAVSSPAALLRTLTRRRDLLVLDVDPAGTEASAQPPLPWAENDERDAVEADAFLDSARLDDPAREIDWLDRLITLADAALAHSSKVAAIERLLTRTREALIVFSEYRDTLGFLELKLQRLSTIATIHGGLSARERRDAVQEFVTGRARALLATDAAGEGLNLQQSCRLVVNVELPWSPVRLEQRIGRVDRIGQTRRVHSVQLVHRDSFEDEVLARFERRRQAAAEMLVHGGTDEQTVADAVFSGRELAHSTTAAPCRALQATAPFELTLTRRRAVATIGTAAPAHPVYARASRRQRDVSHLTALFECDFHDGDGRLIARETVPLLLDVKRGVGRRDFDHIARGLPHFAPVRAALACFVDTRRALVMSEAASTSRAVCDRLRAIDATLADSRRTPLQVSLFDKRAEHAARAHESAIAHLHTHVQHRLRAASALVRISAGTPRLIALWPVVAR